MKTFQLLAIGLLLNSGSKIEAYILQPDTLLTVTDSDQFLLSTERNIDTIVLRDGTQLTGKLHNVPLIKFKDINLTVTMNDADSLFMSPLAQVPKMRFITPEGFSFVCDIPTERIKLIQFFPSEQTPTHTTTQEIEPHTIHHILFATKGAGFPPLRNSHGYIVELNNGDEIPVELKDEEIEVTNGWKSFGLKTSDIVHLTNEGGLYGTINNPLKGQSELDVVLIKDSHLKVEPAKTGKTILIPWEVISSIRLDPSVSLKRESDENNLSENEELYEQSIEDYSKKLKRTFKMNC